MNSDGFSKVFVIIMSTIGFIVLAPIALILLFGLHHTVSAKHAESVMQQQINDLRLSATLVSKTCNTGDGVDSLASCEFKFTGNSNQVKQQLLTAGYTIPGNAMSSTYGNTTTQEFSGETNHKYSISMTSSGDSIKLHLEQ